jgi:hypothetical protein
MKLVYRLYSPAYGFVTPVRADYYLLPLNADCKYRNTMGPGLGFFFHAFLAWQPVTK